MGRYIATILLFISVGRAEALERVELTTVDEDATFFSTFQSHNQRMVETPAGIFLAYMVVAQRGASHTWRLARSVDRGATYQVVYQPHQTYPAKLATKAPVLETDQDGNLYALHPDTVSHTTMLYQFRVGSDYRSPVISEVTKRYHPKYSAILDPKQQRIHLALASGDFVGIDLDGRLLSERTIVTKGPHAEMQYPHLSIDRDNTLHLAWTTYPYGGIWYYWSIEHIRSRDGGATWSNRTGEVLPLPIVADETGLADHVVPQEQLPRNTWLSSLLAEGGVTHFMYLNNPVRGMFSDYFKEIDNSHENYVRIENGEMSADREFERTIPIKWLDGFFARGAQAGEIYFISVSERRIAVAASRDNGHHWFLHALSEPLSCPYAVGGSRVVGPSGIVGAVTEMIDGCQDWSPDIDGKSRFVVKAYAIPPLPSVQ